MAEEARLESVYTSKAYRGFESPSLRKKGKALLNNNQRVFFCNSRFDILALLVKLSHQVLVCGAYLPDSSQ